MKPYLLFTWHAYDEAAPSAQCVGAFATVEEAKAQVPTPAEWTVGAEVAEVTDNGLRLAAELIGDRANQREGESLTYVWSS